MKPAHLFRGRHAAACWLLAVLLLLASSSAGAAPAPGARQPTAFFVGSTTR